MISEHFNTDNQNFLKGGRSRKREKREKKKGRKRGRKVKEKERKMNFSLIFIMHTKNNSQ